MDDAETRRLAIAFGAPLFIHSKPIKGTLRETAGKLGKRMLLFEGGEPRRFSPRAVEAGVAGTLRVLGALGMIADPPPPPDAPPLGSHSTTWVRAPRGGIFRLECHLGASVEKDARLGVIAGPSGRGAAVVYARVAGVVLGHAVNPLVHRGDGLVHIAELDPREPTGSTDDPTDGATDGPGVAETGA
jgi:predicted deacylase